MILCVTLNPCLEKKLTLRSWQAGATNRAIDLRTVVGGKGINVARALSRLGEFARPVQFLGGAVGWECERLLRVEDRLDPVVIATKATTRIITTIVDLSDNLPPTEFADPNPKISIEEAERLRERVEDLLDHSPQPIRAVTLSGSSPCPSCDHLYACMIESAQRRKIPVLLDTYGPVLNQAWSRIPTMIRINQNEMDQFLSDQFDHPNSDDQSTRTQSTLLDWTRDGVSLAIVSQGAAGSLACLDRFLYQVDPPQIEAVNSVGSGDAMLAGLTYGLVRQWSSLESLRFATACGSANACFWDPGFIDRPLVDRLLDRVRLHHIES